MTRAIQLAAVWVLLGSTSAGAVEITDVLATRQVLEVSAKETVEIRFRISEAADVTLYIFDGRDIAVRSVASSGVLPAGEHWLSWDGCDWQGRPVPSEAYHYVLEAATQAGDSALWDLTDATGGETLPVRDVAWDAGSGVIRYALPERARVRIRVGLAGSGPLLSTVIDWVPRAAGASEQPWDGRDASGVLDLSAHPKLALRVEAFSLPRNTLLVTPQADRVALVPDVPGTARRRAVKVKRRKGMYDYAQQPIEQRRDFPVSLRLPDDLPRTAGGVPIVTAPVRVRVDVAPEHARQLIEERFEAVYFLDGTFLFEHETSVLPVSFLWDPQGVSPGVHYLSTNLRGYEGHFGIATQKVEVAAPGAASSGPRDSAGGQSK